MCVKWGAVSEPEITRETREVTKLRLRSGAFSRFCLRGRTFGTQIEREYISFARQQVTDLRPETNYVFLVRAENSHGLSLPGPLSDVVQTTNVNQHTVPQVELTRARDRLNSEILHLKEVQSLSSTSVKIMWDVSVDRRPVVARNCSLLLLAQRERKNSKTFSECTSIRFLCSQRKCHRSLGCFS